MISQPICFRSAQNSDAATVNLMTATAQVLEQYLDRLRRSGAEVHTMIDRWGVANYHYVWRAETERSRGVVQLVHGIGEHAGRYIAIAGRLTAAGFDVIADDHRGHGATGAAALDVPEDDPAGAAQTDTLRAMGRLGKGGLEATILAVRAVSRAAAELGDGRPPVIFGHSWGSFLTQHLLNIRSQTYSAAVLTGTAYCQPGWVTPSRFNRRWDAPGASGYEWLSSRPEVGRAYAADPLTTDRTVLSSHGFWDALRLFTRPTPRIRSDIPLLIANGTDDPVGSPKSVERLAQAYRDVGLQHVDVRLYEGMRHEIFNEVDGDQVISDIIAWIEQQL
ncbi:alpha/beta hydrolase [Pseudoclavibacter sp. CFCC 11306]|nr:alpha/beta hydrolase [Pseudoclavibacter sp. CFCC 11306]